MYNMHFVLSLVSFLVVNDVSLANRGGHRRSGSGQNDERINGCTLYDITYFSSTLAELFDIFDLSQENNIVSDDLIDFSEEKMTEDFTFKVMLYESGVTIPPIYTSRDEWLYGDSEIGSQGFAIDLQSLGRVWFYNNVGYGKCSQDESGVQRATFISRGGDNLRSDLQNIVFINRFNLSFVKVDESQDESDSSDHSYDTWKMDGMEYGVIQYGTFEITS